MSTAWLTLAAPGEGADIDVDALRRRLFEQVMRIMALGMVLTLLAGLGKALSIGLHPAWLLQVARHAGANRTTLNALFAEHLGLSAFAYLREQRLRRGRDLLLQTELTGP